MNNIRQIRDLLAMLASIADVHRKAQMQWSVHEASTAVRSACVLESRHVLSIVAMLATDARIDGMGERTIPYHYLVDHVCKDERQRMAIACLAIGMATATDLVPLRIHG
jgi:hypothetical protein